VLFAGALSGALATADDVTVPAKGVIRGRVTIDGKTEHHRFAIDESVVSLSGGDLVKLSAPPPAEPVVMDQNGIAYVPTVLAIVAGTTVEFRNSDPVLHNVHCQCTLNRPFNQGMQKGENTRVKFERPEIIEVTCNIHANMKAFIVVLENSFYSKVSNGEFRIEAPAGTFDLKGWHDGTKSSVQKVTVKPGEETVVDINLTTKKR
jgi:plastocyanin